METSLNRENNEEYRACAAVLLQEIDLLEKIPPLQTLIRDAVINREWADYEFLMESIGKIGVQFEMLEEERMVLFSKLFEETSASDACDGRFYSLAVHLPDGERVELTNLYRRLKMETLQIRLANDTLLEYLGETRTAVAAALESAYPNRKGRIYSRQGTAEEPEMKSIVLNTTF